MAESDQPWITKLARAATHVEHLHAETARYLAEEPKPRLDVEPTDGREYLLRLRVPKQPDPEWAAVIGDVLHNVRSALDSATWAVVGKHMPRPMKTGEEAGVVFPIYKANEAFDKGRWAPSDLPEPVRNVFRSVQPFVNVHGRGHASDVETEQIDNHPLMLLKTWSNIDKHRGMHATVCALVNPWVALPEGADSRWLGADPWPWHDGSIVFRVPIDGLNGGSPVFGDTFAVALEEDAGPLSAPAIHDRLGGLVTQARLTLLRVLPLLD